ncbi:hypothetical protein VTN02DRAFT_3912 [Thermoascus thermophilus]
MDVPMHRTYLPSLVAAQLVAQLHGPIGQGSSKRSQSLEMTVKRLSKDRGRARETQISWHPNVLWSKDDYLTALVDSEESNKPGFFTIHGVAAVARGILPVSPPSLKHCKHAFAAKKDARTFFYDGFPGSFQWNAGPAARMVTLWRNAGSGSRHLGIFPGSRSGAKPLRTEASVPHAVST